MLNLWELWYNDTMLNLWELWYNDTTLNLWELWYNDTMQALGVTSRCSYGFQMRLPCDLQPLFRLLQNKFVKHKQFFDSE